MGKDLINEHPDIQTLEDQIKVYEERLEGHEGVQRSLQQSQDRYRTVVEHTGTATMVISDLQTVTMVNTSFERLTGLAKSAVEHRYKLMDLVPAAEREKLMHYFTDRRRSRNGPEDLALTIQDSRGAVKDILLKIDLVASTGECIGSMIDISQLKKVETELSEQRAQLGAILDAFEGQIYVSNTDYQLTYANEQLTSNIGDGAVGQNCYEVIHGRTSPCPFCVIDQVTAGQTVRFEVKNPRDQNWYYSMNAPIRHVDGTVTSSARARPCRRSTNTSSMPAPLTPQRSSSAKRAPVRSWWPMPFMT